VQIGARDKSISQQRESALEGSPKESAPAEKDLQIRPMRPQLLDAEMVFISKEWN
jgi:hypothetical protein